MVLSKKRARHVIEEIIATLSRCQAKSGFS